MRKFVIVVLVAFSVVSVSFGEEPYYYRGLADKKAQTIKEMLAELEYYEQKCGINS